MRTPTFRHALTALAATGALALAACGSDETDGSGDEPTAGSALPQGSEHVVRAPVRARIVVPVQFIPNLVAALQEHMRVYSESYQNTGWVKGPVH